MPPWTLVCLMIAACGEIGGAPTEQVPSARVQHLSLVSHGTPPVDLVPTLVQRLDVPRELPAWSVDGQPEVRLLQRPLGNLNTLHVEGPGNLRVTIPGEFVARSFNQVAVTLVVGEQRPVSLEFRHEGAIVRRSRPLTALATEDVQTVVFDLPTMQRERAVFDELSVVFPARSGPVSLVSVALVNKPHHRWVPDPEGPPRPIEIDGEWRPGVGLSSERSLTANFQQRPGARFEFDWGAPEGVRLAHVPLELEVRLEDARGGVKEQRIPIEDDLTVRARWTEVSMSLDHLEGRIEATFRLIAPPGQTAYVVVGEPRLVRRSENPPTVLLITSDAHRADHIGASNSGVGVATPFLDELASRGVLFEDCVAASNETHPSHAALMTGLSPRDTGILSDEESLTDEALTLAERFRVAGFLTYASVSLGSLGPGRSGLDQGFDRISAPLVEARDSAETLAVLGDWLARSEGVPVFVWLHVADAHGPYDPPGSWRRRYYDSRRDPADASLAEPPEWLMPEFHEEVRDPEYVRALYRSEISYLDAQLARLLGYGRLQGGVVAFTADHGESLGAHDVYFGHDELYPDTLRVPLILVAPGLEPRRITRPVDQLDLGQTLLRLAGVRDGTFPGQDLIEVPVDRFGVSLGERPERPRFSLSRDGLSASVFYQQKFLVLHLQRHRLANPTVPPIRAHTVELYDLARDPNCQRDIAGERPDEARKLRGQLVEWLGEASVRGLDTPAMAPDPATIEALASTDFVAPVRPGLVERWIDTDCRCERCAEYR